MVFMEMTILKYLLNVKDINISKKKKLNKIQIFAKYVHNAP